MEFLLSQRALGGSVLKLHQFAGRPALSVEMCRSKRTCGANGGAFATPKIKVDVLANPSCFLVTSQKLQLQWVYRCSVSLIHGTMVVFLDLDEDDVSDPDPHVDPIGFAGYERALRQRGSKPRGLTAIGESGGLEATESVNPNVNSVSAALGCYPYISIDQLSYHVITNISDRIIIQITGYIDLNALHSLSLTCRQIRYNLLQYRRRLVQRTLHCENEAQNASLATLKPSGQKWHILGEAGHLVSGKVSQCARDLVDGCRRCGRIVCRVRCCCPFNIMAKPPNRETNFASELHPQTPFPFSPPFPSSSPLPHLSRFPSLSPHT